VHAQTLCNQAGRLNNPSLSIGKGEADTNFEVEEQMAIARDVHQQSIKCTKIIEKLIGASRPAIKLILFEKDKEIYSRFSIKPRSGTYLVSLKVESIDVSGALYRICFH